MATSFHTKMLNVAKTHSLPEYYQSDLMQDINILLDYEGYQFVWLLRTSGTVLFPIKVGADPIIISHWLYSDHDNRKITFLVDPKEELIEIIPFEKAEKLIYELPTPLTSIMSFKELETQANKVIDSGIDRGIWGLFNKPTITSKDWEGCIKYYHRTENRVMTAYMDRAINLRKRIIQAQSSGVAA